MVAVKTRTVNDTSKRAQSKQARLQTEAADGRHESSLLMAHTATNVDGFAKACSAERKCYRRMSMMKDDAKLLAILADVDEVLVRHSADTAQVVAAGQQLIYTAFGQIVDDCPSADHAALADRLAQALRQRLLGRLRQGPAEMAQA